MISAEMKAGLKAGSGIRDAFNEARRQKELYGENRVFDLSLGNPAALAPRRVRDILKALSAQEDLNHGYMCEAGYEEVRRSIAESLNRHHGTSYSEDNIVMTNGVAGGINVVFRALLDPGDEVIIFKPYYPSYVGFVKNWQGKPVLVEPQEDFQPDLKELEAKISERTKAVIVNSPHNPTGVIYTEETIRGIADILKRAGERYGHAVCLLSDEPYRDLVYDGTALPWIPDYYDHTIVSYSFSKSLSLAGERIGYLLIPSVMEESDTVIRAVRMAMGRLGFVNAPAFFQRVTGACVNETVDLEYYAKNRKLLLTVLQQYGYECAEPQGAFYVFVKVPDGDEQHFMKLAEKRHLIFVAGSSFGMPGYVRISFCGSHSVLENATPALKLLAEDCGISENS